MDAESGFFWTHPTLQTPWKHPNFLTFRCPQYEICPDGLSTRPQHHFTALSTKIVSKNIDNTESSTNQVSIKQRVNAISSPEQIHLSDVRQIHYHSRYQHATFAFVYFWCLFASESVVVVVGIEKRVSLKMKKIFKSGQDFYCVQRWKQWLPILGKIERVFVGRWHTPFNGARVKSSFKSSLVRV